MREKISRLANLRFPEWSMPLAFLAALSLAFGLLIPTLGFYQDDWLFVYNHYALGPEGIWEFMYYDGTPFASYLNNLQFALLGYTPLNWHIASLLSRWLTVVVFWLILRRLWPGHPRETFFSALLFALHPFFTIQPMAVTFSQVWVAYFFLGLSLYWMILSVQQPSRYWLYTLLSILTGTVNILSGEYFAGLEFARPVILWFALAEHGLRPKERLLASLRYWLPYLLALSVYIYWRFFVYEVPIEDRNQPVLVETLLRNPLEGLWLIFLNLLPDTVSIVISSWYALLEPGWLDLTARINQFALVLVLLSGGVAFFYLKVQTFSEAKHSHRVNWSLQALFFGLVIVVFGLIPPYVAGMYLNAKNPLWNSRLGMASMLGAAMIVVVLLELLVSSARARITLMAVLVGLSVGWHFRYTNNFRWAWKKEVNFYRQLTLRIPQLTPGTALVAEGEVLYLMGDYPTAYAINTFYANPRGEQFGQAKYWFYGLTTNFGAEYHRFTRGIPFYTRQRSMVFEGDSLQSIVFSFDPEYGQCLRIYRPDDAKIAASILSPYLLKAVPASRPELILTTSPPGSSFAGQIDLQAQKDWCYYYQKADLARQNQDWQEIARLWQELRTLGLNSAEAFEYLPFIEGLLRQNNFDEAQRISLHVVTFSKEARSIVCNAWQSVSNEMLGNLELLQTFQQFSQTVECK